MGLKIPETNEFWHSVKKGIEFGLDCWDIVVKTAIKEALSDLEKER